MLYVNILQCVHFKAFYASIHFHLLLKVENPDWKTIPFLLYYQFLNPACHIFYHVAYHFTLYPDAVINPGFIFQPIEVQENHVKDQI